MRRLILLCAFPLFGQQVQPVIPQPDCAFYFSLTTTTQRFPAAGYDNRHNGCVTWAVTYFNAGFSPVSLELDSAPDSSGAAGTWGAFSGTVVAGSNPMTSATQTFNVATGYNPWISVKNNSTGAGTITGFAYGFRVPPQTYVSGGASVSSNVNVAQYGGSAVALGQALMASSMPVAIASNQSAIPTNQTQLGGSAVYPCEGRAVIALSGSGNTQIIAASGTTTIRICHVSLSTSVGENIKFTSGTGSNCGTGTANLTEFYQSVTALAFDFGSFSPLTAPAGAAVCVNQSGSQTTGGVVLYDQR